MLQARYSAKLTSCEGLAAGLTADGRLGSRCATVGKECCGLLVRWLLLLTDGAALPGNEEGPACSLAGIIAPAAQVARR